MEASLAEVLAWLFRTPAPSNVDAKARLLVMDTLGCATAARRHTELMALERSFESADPGSVSAAASSFAAAACWDEACEGLARAHGRPGLTVLAACQALAQRHSLTYGDLLTAYITGYEVGGRFGESMRVAPGMHVDGAWPAFGVATAVVRLLGGNAVQALAAIRIVACQMPFSLYLPVAAGANARNTYLSHAAQLGMLAANAALAGIVAPEGAVDELKARALQGALAAPLIAPPGEWLLLEAYLKPFASVRHAHYGVTCALALRPKLVDRLARITRIELSTYAEAIAYAGNRAPNAPITAQFSLSYCVACALATGELGPGSYDFRKDVLELEKKIVLAEDKTLSGRGATLTIEVDGETLSHSVNRVTGDPSLPMTRAQALEKFSRYAARDGARLLDAAAGTAWAELSRA
jgi:2-methylcitrate dehydratase PrpD